MRLDRQLLLRRRFPSVVRMYIEYTNPSSCTLAADKFFWRGRIPELPTRLHLFPRSTNANAKCSCTIAYGDPILTFSSDGVMASDCMSMSFRTMMLSCCHLLPFLLLLLSEAKIAAVTRSSSMYCNKNMKCLNKANAQNVTKLPYY